ncbi:MAG: glycerol-3-phosphate dehydrogenase subunit GlpB [Flavobacteriaceae bacterium]|jgi:glycerol-3-phosphate dehydrogenase subunit B|nr:glycerol-3-phosphate dehydrogenase subunit GlpB [Flavobacteriaceae bacterium]
MKFDTVIIGGGLTGLVSGIRLVQQGQKCVIVSSGQSALHFFSGSFDLLNSLPDGSSVKNPEAAIEDLASQAPEHPYVKLGKAKFTELAREAKKFLSEIGIKTHGTSDKNHYRITPVGMLKPAWLTMSGFAFSEDHETFPWKKATLLNIEGFLDFHPEFISEAFEKMNVETEIKHFNLPELSAVRKNPSEFRSTNLSIIFDKEENLDTLAQIFSKNSKDSDVIIFPDCIGLKDTGILSRLIEKVGKPVFLIPTFPPSLVGIRTQQHLKEYFIKSGGIYMLGDNVTHADVEEHHVSKVYTHNHGDIPLMADNVILATGSFFSQGLIADTKKIYEPVFELDTDYLPNRADWYNPNFFEKQNYQQFGVKTNSNFNGIKDNKPIDNLFVSGAVLNGFNPLKEGNGAGVSILTALYVAEQILNQKKTHESNTQ